MLLRHVYPELLEGIRISKKYHFESDDNNHAINKFFCTSNINPGILIKSTRK